MSHMQAKAFMLVKTKSLNFTLGCTWKTETCFRTLACLSRSSVNGSSSAKLSWSLKRETTIVSRFGHFVKHVEMASLEGAGVLTQSSNTLLLRQQSGHLSKPISKNLSTETCLCSLMCDSASLFCSALSIMVNLLPADFSGFSLVSRCACCADRFWMGDGGEVPAGVSWWLVTMQSDLHAGVEFPWKSI